MLVSTIIIVTTRQTPWKWNSRKGPVEFRGGCSEERGRFLRRMFYATLEFNMILNGVVKENVTRLLNEPRKYVNLPSVADDCSVIRNPTTGKIMKWYCCEIHVPVSLEEIS